MAKTKLSAVLLSALLFAACAANSGEITPPTEKPNVTAAKAALGITLTWGAVPTAKTYTIFWSPKPSSPETLEFYAAVGSSITQYLIEKEDLTAGKTYYFQICTQNDAGDGPWSDKISCSY